MVYYSKTDTWLVILIASAIVIPLVTGIGNVIVVSYFLDASWDWSSLLSSMLPGVSILSVVYPLYYEISDSALKIHSGWFIREQILLSTIEEVYPTKSSLSAPALSCDRLRINYSHKGRKRSTMISPQDKDRFMQELVNRDAGLERQDDRIIRISEEPTKEA